jgi:HPt (histidine-containing phosphotransfer) domain-containing protein
MDKHAISDRVSLPPKSILDVQGALERLGGDEELLSDMIGFYVEDAPRLLAVLRSALAACDDVAARRAAHGLKGLILGCGGVRAARTAQTIEDFAHTGDLDSAMPLVDVFAEDLDTLAAAAGPYRH